MGCLGTKEEDIMPLIAKPCPNCTASLSPTATFCIKCGHFLKKAKKIPSTDPIPPELRCSNCTVGAGSHSTFCEKCGHTYRKPKGLKPKGFKPKKSPGNSQPFLPTISGLLQWCQDSTENYKNVRIINFNSSWADGLAFCAIIHRYRPNLIPYDQLTQKNPRFNFQLAFDVAEKNLGIGKLINVEDILKYQDEFWITTYLGELFQKL